MITYLHQVYNPHWQELEDIIAEVEKEYCFAFYFKEVVAVSEFEYVAIFCHETELLKIKEAKNGK